MSRYRNWWIMLGLICGVMFFLANMYDMSKTDYDSERQVELKLISIETHRNSNSQIIGHHLVVEMEEGGEKTVPLMLPIAPLPQTGDLMPFSILKREDSPDQYVFRLSQWKKRQLDP